MEDKKYFYRVWVIKNNEKVFIEHFNTEEKAKERLAAIKELITTFELWNEINRLGIDKHIANYRIYQMKER